jgi:hypothetical protein
MLPAAQAGYSLNPSDFPSISESQKNEEQVKQLYRMRTKMTGIAHRLEQAANSTNHAEIVKIAKEMHDAIGFKKAPTPPMKEKKVNHPFVDSELEALKSKVEDLSGLIVGKRKSALTDAQNDKTCENIRLQIEKFIALNNEYVEKMKELKKPLLAKITHIEGKLAAAKTAPATPEEIKKFSILMQTSEESIQADILAYEQVMKTRAEHLEKLKNTVKNINVQFANIVDELEYYKETYRYRGEASWKTSHAYGLNLMRSYDPELKKTKFTEIAKLN